MLFWRCDPEELDPAFRRDVEAFLEPSPYIWYALSGYRSMEEQRKLYDAYRLKLGPKAAPPGRSAHNYRLAIDVVLDTDPDKPGLQPSWDTKLAGWLWLKAKSIPHPRLKNGWSFGDWPHLERYNWRRLVGA